MASKRVMNSFRLISSNSFPPYKNKVCHSDSVNRTQSVTSIYGPIQFQFGGTAGDTISTPLYDSGSCVKSKIIEWNGNSNNESLLTKLEPSMELCEVYSDSNMELKPEPNENEYLLSPEPPKLTKLTNRFSKSVPSFNQFETETKVEPKKRRKSVTFADSEGMELTEVFYFKPFNILSSSDSNQDELEVATNFETTNSKMNKQINFKTNFQCGNKNPKFITFLQTNNVALETISVDWNFITGWIHVLNLEYNKNVVVRWTQNDWLTTNNTNAVYEYSLKSVFVDVFVFKIPVKLCRIEFAISYTTCGQEFWDNNSGTNYFIECYF